MTLSQNGQAHLLWDLTFYQIFVFLVIILTADMLKANQGL